MMTSSNGPIASVQKGWTQPPKRKSLVGSSSGPPGACITPSSDRKQAPVSLRIDRLALQSGLDLGDVDLLHCHHRFEGALGRGLVGTIVSLEQDARRDLPGEAPLVLAPAAGTLLPAVADDRVPIAVGLLLIFRNDHEADGFVGREVGAAVETHERLAEDREVDGQLVALMAVRIVTGRSHGR